MVFWPNLRPIGGYVFSEIGHLFIPIFGPFLHFLTIFGPFSAVKAKNILNWTLQVQKEPKKLKKLVQKLYCKLGSPNSPKSTPGPKNTLKQSQMAENSKNVLHGTKLTGLWPKKTFLSQSSKKLQIWHGTTLQSSTLLQLELELVLVLHRVNNPQSTTSPQLVQSALVSVLQLVANPIKCHYRVLH